MQWVPTAAARYMIDEMKGGSCSRAPEPRRAARIGRVEGVGVNSFTRASRRHSRRSPARRIVHDRSCRSSRACSRDRGVARARDSARFDARSRTCGAVAETSETSSRDHALAKRVDRRRVAPGALREVFVNTAHRPGPATSSGRPDGGGARTGAAIVRETGLHRCWWQARLDGHSNGASRSSRRAPTQDRNVIYQGIRLTPAEIAAAPATRSRRRRSLDPVRSHLGLVPRYCGLLREARSTRRRMGHYPDADAPNSRRWASPALHAQGLQLSAWA